MSTSYYGSPDSIVIIYNKNGYVSRSLYSFTENGASIDYSFTDNGASIDYSFTDNGASIDYSFTDNGASIARVAGRMASAIAADHGLRSSTGCLQSANIVLEGKGFHTACASRLRFCATGCVIFWRNPLHWSSSSSHRRLECVKGL